MALTVPTPRLPEPVGVLVAVAWVLGEALVRWLLWRGRTRAT